MRTVYLAHRAHLVGNTGGVIERKHHHFGEAGVDRLSDGSNVNDSCGNAETGTPAQRAGQQLRLHEIGIGKENIDGGGNL